MSKLIAINQPRSSYYVGGAELVSLYHASNLSRIGYRVLFITINPRSIEQSYSPQYLYFKDRYKDIEFVELNQQCNALSWYNISPGENRDRWNVESLFFNSSVYDYLLKMRISIDVLISYYKLDSVVVPRTIVKMNCLYLCGIPSENNNFMSSFLAMYDSIIAITDDTRLYWQPYSLQTIKVIPTGVDTDRFRPKIKSSQKTKIVFVGRLIERKGCDNLIRAISKLPNIYKESISVRIVGDGPQRKKLEELVSKFMIDEYIEFTGEISNPEDILSRSDICILPSKYGEGLQGIILEAMSSECFVIATATPTNRLLLSDGRGSLVSNNPSEIASEIMKSIDNKYKLAKSAKRARKYVIKNHSWDKITTSLIEGFVK